MAEEEKKPGSKRKLVLRIIFAVVVIVVLVFGVRWRMLASEYKKGVAFYEQGEYQQAHDIFNAVQAKTLAALRLRNRARIGMGRCKAELATETAFKDKSLEGYTTALQLLEEAKALCGPSGEVDRRIKEYTEYKEKAGSAAVKELASSEALTEAE